jgi:hypothetical protein
LFFAYLIFDMMTKSKIDSPGDGMSERTYESYPFSIFFIASLTSLLNYLLGALIFYLAGGVVLGIAYLVIAFISLALAMRFRCAYCYYHGRRCPTGLGILAGLLFRQRDNVQFANPKNITPVAIVSFSVLFLPLIAGIVYLLFDFTLIMLVSLLLYLMIAVVLGFSLRKNYICKHCKQGDLACPAYEGMKGTAKT